MIDESMADWAIVVTNGVRLVGRWAAKTSLLRRLSPVYELQIVQAIVQAPRAPPNIVMAGTNAGPPLGFDELAGIDIPEGALILSVRDLTPANRRALREGLEGFEKLRAQQRSGLVLAGADALNGQAAKLRQQ